jgi:hypothetical protein
MVYEEDTKFIITSDRKNFVEKYRKGILQAKTCEMIFPAIGLKFALFYFLSCLKMTLKKGAKIRIITEITEDASISRNLEILKENPFFEIKFAPSAIHFGMTIFNDKDVHMCISCITSEVPSLQTNNPQVVEMAKTLFDAMWTK